MLIWIHDYLYQRAAPGDTLDRSEALPMEESPDSFGDAQRHASLRPDVRVCSV
jgi:hypothetical protein